MILENYRLILVSPLYAGNVGSIARLGGNFELEDIHIIKPQCSLDDKEAMQMACKYGQKILQELKISSSLEESLEDCVTTIALSRRSGNLRQKEIEINDIHSFAKKGKVALLFGREDSGLTQEEMHRAHFLCAIDSSSCSPSLNLSQSVAIILSRLFEYHNIHKKASFLEKERWDKKYATQENIFRLWEHWENVLVQIGFTKGGNPERILKEIQRILLRAELMEEEVQMFRGFLSRIEISLQKALSKNKDI